ncbi:hypothetical protein [Motilibacter aurantiacus]|uniref:hypothetical protein n=1 Tax=Motilibacter aurantiacus TaxID=2714955 RepID=UPI00140E5A4D|nr:hypothetical protein [Motilibacter aurantiacus]NHC44839.1 hypothetical protein [Motilibacter aurantiacus]
MTTQSSIAHTFPDRDTAPAQSERLGIARPAGDVVSAAALRLERARVALAQAEAELRAAAGRTPHALVLDACDEVLRARADLARLLSAYGPPGVTACASLELDELIADLRTGALT